MSQTISESRFYMWRAVFAFIHADHKVTEQERQFAGNYLTNVPFSEEQKTILRNDLDEPKEVSEMFDKITVPSDRGEFFEFARNLLWADGDYAQTEERMFEHLMKSYMFKLDPEAMRAEVRKVWDLGRLQREADDAQFEERAGDILGPLAFLKGMVKR